MIFCWIVLLNGRHKIALTIPLWHNFEAFKIVYLRECLLYKLKFLGHVLITLVIIIKIVITRVIIRVGWIDINTRHSWRFGFRTLRSCSKLKFVIGYYQKYVVINLKTNLFQVYYMSMLWPKLLYIHWDSVWAKSSLLLMMQI